MFLASDFTESMSFSSTFGRRFLGAALAALVLCGPPAAYADIVTDNFSDGTDGSAGTTTNPIASPPNVTGPVWTRLDDEIASHGQTWDASTGEYRLTALNDGIELANPGKLGFVASYVGSSSFTDVSVMADFVSPTASGYSFGVMVRSNGVNSFGGLTGYTYAYTGGVPRMEIGIFDGFNIGEIANTVLTGPLDLVNKKYTFSLTAVGDQLTGKVFEIGGGLVATTTVTDSTLTSGYSGVIGISGTTATGVTPMTPLGTTTDFTIDNFRTEDAQAAVPGDYNNNGKVDAADYVVWRNGGSPDNSQAGYDLWKANFGKPPGSGSGSIVPVPEPASAALALLGLVSLWFGRRNPGR